jgi:hypothetical protein
MRRNIGGISRQLQKMKPHFTIALAQIFAESRIFKKSVALKQKLLYF